MLTVASRALAADRGTAGSLLRSAVTVAVTSSAAQIPTSHVRVILALQPESQLSDRNAPIRL
jgi:hypothetical protein